MKSMFLLPEHHRPRVGLVPVEVLHAAVAVEEDDAAVALPQGIMHPAVEGDEGGAIEPVNHIAPCFATGGGGNIDWPPVADADLFLSHAEARGLRFVFVLRGGLGLGRGGLRSGRCGAGVAGSEEGCGGDGGEDGV